MELPLPAAKKVATLVVAAQTADDPDTIGDTGKAKTATTDFIKDNIIATKYPGLLTFKSKLEKYQGDTTVNVMKWNIGIMELWIVNSTDKKSDDITIYPKLRYPGVTEDGGMSGVTNAIGKGEKLPAQFVSRDNDGKVIFTADFSVTREANGDQLTGSFSLTSDKLGNIAQVDTPLFKIHDQAS